jgi:hypothetical protein
MPQRTRRALPPQRAEGSPSFNAQTRRLGEVAEKHAKKSGQMNIGPVRGLSLRCDMPHECLASPCLQLQWAEVPDTNPIVQGGRRSLAVLFQ